MVLTLVLCLCGGLDTGAAAVDVVDTIDAQQATAESLDGELITPAAAQPQPSADDYDTRLYRADLARAKRWGS